MLLPLTAEADRVLYQLVMFLTAFYHWMYKMEFGCCLLLFMANLFIGFLVEKYVAFESRKSSDGIVFVFNLWIPAITCGTLAHTGICK